MIQINGWLNVWQNNQMVNLLMNQLGLHKIMILLQNNYLMIVNNYSKVNVKNNKDKNKKQQHKKMMQLYQ